MRVRAVSSSSFDPGLRLSPIVKWIVYATVATSIASAFGSAWLGWPMEEILGLVPAALVGMGDALPWIPAIWQPLTYALVATSPWSILSAILVYGWFASDLERTWGARLFLDRWLLLVAGVAVSVVLSALFVAPMRHALTIGPSEVVEGLVIAWGLTFPDRRIYLFWFVPVTGRIMVFFTVGMLVLSAVFDGPSAFPFHVPALVACALGWGAAKQGWSARRVWLLWEKRRIQREIDRDRTVH